MAEQNKRIQFLQDALRNLAKAVREVSGGLIDLDKTISKLTGKTKEFAKEQQQAAQAVNRVGKNLKDTAKTVEDYGKKTDKATKSSKGFFGGLRKNLKTIISFYGAYQLLNGAFLVVNELFVKSAKRAIAFEKALADLRAVAGLSAEDVSRLRDVVFDVAGATSLTTIEVVELQKQLAKLGAPVDEIENLTRPIALLSQALGEDAGGVAATLKKTLNQFQATSEEADRFANILTGAVNETALSLDDLGTALSYVGPLGAQLGVSFEETSALLGILADNGFKASKAGTGLRNFFVAAAKDGRPFNDFLDDVANRNLTAAENFQIFGKVGASQAKVLGDNVEKFKELSEELRTSDRLFKANAVQMASTEGQIQLLSSAYEKFSTNLGEAITKTDIFITLIGIFDQKAAGQASAYRLISSSVEETQKAVEGLISVQREFSEGADTAISETELVAQAFKALGDSVGVSEEFFLKKFNIALKNTGDAQSALTTLTKTLNAELTEAALTIQGLIDLTKERSGSLDEEYIAQEANNESVKNYKKEYSGLQKLTAQGISVDKQKQVLQSQIAKDSEKYSDELKELRSRMGPLTQAEEERAQILEKRIALLTKESERIGELKVAEDTLAEKKKKADKAAAELRKKNFKEETDAIQKTLEAEIDAAKAITDVELAGAKTAEEAAQIRLKQEKLVQAAYQNSLRSINNLKDIYPEFANEIENASDKYEKFTQFTQSDIGQEGITIISDYRKQFEELGKKLKDNEISLGEYATQEDALEASLISSITTLKNSTAANEELKDMLDKVVVSYLNAKKGADDYVESTEEEFKKIKILGKEFVQDLTAEEAIGMALATTADAISNFNDTALENTKARLEAEKDEISARYEVEQDILKSQLDNQLITESQYRQKQKELRKAQLAEENDVDKKIFESEKKRDRQNATTGYLQALASIIPNLIIYDKEGNPIDLSIKAALSGALATAAYGAELSAISQKKFFPKKFADGGMVNGPSHAEGGVPFSVQGRGGYEMEGGEYIVNKRATSMHRDLLERINKSGRTKATAGSMRFAEGGLVSSPLNESVDYLKAIAEATTSTAIGVSKPVRAYVADKDLRGNATERRIRDRNDRI
jgi:hypothetical protein